MNKEDTVISVKDVTMNFRMAEDKIQSLKEFVVKKLSGKISYKYFTALKDVNLDIKREEVWGILGHNGAGKSTLLKIVSGILDPTEGSVEINGNIVPLLELGSGFDVDLSGMENIFLNGAILGYSESFLKEKAEEIIEFSELREFMSMPVRNYSSGMVARLAFSIATVVNPEIFIVDEILSVGDSDFQKKSGDRMKEMIKGNTTVLFVSHDLKLIREICTKAIWIERGKVQMIGDSKEVCDAYENL